MTEGAEMKGERIAQLELLLRSHPEGIRRAEIARRLGVHRSTISRYVEELANYIDIYEENNLIKIRVSDDEPSNMELSIYECLAFNMGAEALAGKAEFANPHLASGLRKLAMNMKSYAPKISENALSIADRIDKAIQENRSETGQFNQVLEVLIDCWVSGRIARITTDIPEKEEIEIAPYFIGFKDESNGRKPITVTGRLRHTRDIITLDISSITGATMLNQTYTIPDNLKPFSKKEDTNSYDAIDMIPLVLKLKEKSALNSFSSLMHSDFDVEKTDDGYICRMEAENSIELMLRIVQCGTSVKILSPDDYRSRFISVLKNILALYEDDIHNTPSR